MPKDPVELESASGLKDYRWVFKFSESGVKPRRSASSDNRVGKEYQWALYPDEFALIHSSDHSDAAFHPERRVLSSGGV